MAREATVPVRAAASCAGGTCEGGLDEAAVAEIPDLNLLASSGLPSISCFYFQIDALFYTLLSVHILNAAEP